jgi:hypothetical protein
LLCIDRVETVNRKRDSHAIRRRVAQTEFVLGAALSFYIRSPALVKLSQAAAIDEHVQLETRVQNPFATGDAFRLLEWRCCGLAL